MIGKIKDLSRKDKKAFVIGEPIDHSLSPALHGFWLRQLGIDGSYEGFSVPADYLARTIYKLRDDGYAGGNVTIPHKEKVMLLCDEVSERAQKIGAVNTLVFDGDKILGDNTDAEGFAAGLGGFKPKKAMVLGAGGAARAVIVALQELGAEVYVSNRTAEKAEKLAQEFSCKTIAWENKDELSESDFLVNTTSLGMESQPELDIDIKSLPDGSVVYDLVYNPIETDLLKQAHSLGLKNISGLWMLIHQAAPGFEKWFGEKPETTQDIYDHLILELNKRGWKQA